MSMKQFCKTLKQCAEKLEEDLKYNINGFHNQFFGKTMTETKLALERAKDYHYKEIIDSIAIILKNVEIIIFHQDKIEWLGQEDNFTSEDLKRFSYVKRQVFAFSKQDNVSRSEENLSKNVSKRERRRTASEISIGTLEAWEKYLDKKEDPIENIEEIKKIVPKRTLSNARARKKFVSSTVGGFLDYEERRRNLDSIVERSSFDERNDFNRISECIEESTIQNNEGNGVDTKTDVFNEVNNNPIKEEDLGVEIVENLGAVKMKPKIVDVVYKKNPSLME
ncbi:unnamed protein product [Ceutorhynchus assimilis]|uniref:Uncharacterized protein n=1 Tax=Ceutorhynchus assimilis TaxID=467358 RepID=A0A9N9N241_9CUCU|nr:unnamed protein product [Ceutorhynchus assimilis]